MKSTKLLFASAVATALLMMNTASAQTNYNWSGAADGATWSLPGNWVGGVVPVTNLTTTAIFIGTGFPTTTPTPINIGASDLVVASDQLFGPEWGETLNIHGTVNVGFGIAPVGAIGGPKSTINMYGTASLTSGDSVFIGDMFWFPGAPNVDFNMNNSSKLTTRFLMPGGHLNMYDSSVVTVSVGLLAGTPNAGAFGGISSDATRWINLAGGKLILPTGNSNYVLSLIDRGIFFCYGKKYDTNEFTMTDDGTNTTISVVASLGALNSVSVQSSGVTNLMVGTRQTAIAVGNFANLSAVPLSMINSNQSGGGTIAYKSSNTNVASISAAGLINALNTGTTTITVTYSNSTFGSFVGNNSLLITVTPFTNSLIHRYSFSESSGTSASDSVGGANGDLFGGATLGSGEVALNGVDGFVQLPAGIVSGLDAVSVEAWVNFGTPAPFATLFAFGDQDTQPTPLGMNYIMFQPYRTNAVATNAAALFGLGDPGSGNEQNAETSIVSGGVNTLLGSVHVVAVYHPYAGYVAFYTNGVLAAVNNAVTHPLASTLGVDPLNVLGASLYATDPFLNASINEFRIYNGALSAGQIAADRALGPDQLRGTSTTVSLTVSRTNNSVTVTWPTTSSLVSLMSSPTLGAGAAWTPVNMSSLSAVSGNYRITIPATAAAQFFRLQY